MNKKKTWISLGWPWELDLLTLIFVLVALGAPYFIFSEYTANTTIDNPVTSQLNEQAYILWAIGICVLFVMHLALAGSILDTLSTPFLHLVAPLVFALLAYYRIHAVSSDLGNVTPVNGSLSQIALLVGSTLAVSLLIAKLRTVRHLMRFRDVTWDKMEKSSFDSSFFELITQFRPLIYTPRLYRACSEGILVQGWFYTLAMPFEMIQSISAVRTMNISSDGDYYATNTHSLIRFELLDRNKPVFISPDNRDDFVHYCAHHVARIRPSTNHASRHGTLSGLYARHTQSGGTQPGVPPTTHG